MNATCSRLSGFVWLGLQVVGLLGLWGLRVGDAHWHDECMITNLKPTLPGALQAVQPPLNPKPFIATARVRRSRGEEAETATKSRRLVALIISIGFGVYYSIVIIRSPQNPNLFIKAPTLGSLALQRVERHGCQLAKAYSRAQRFGFYRVGAFPL